jgi:hypothetical protein
MQLDPSGSSALISSLCSLLLLPLQESVHPNVRGLLVFTHSPCPGASGRPDHIGDLGAAHE